MLELASRVQPLIQNLGDTLIALPWWAALAVLVIPSALAMVTGRVWVIAATVLLDAASIALLPPSLGTPAAVVSLYTLALVVALIGFRERRQTRWQADMDERLEQVAKQMMVFLQALDRRTQEIERMREASLASRAPAAPAAPATPRS